MFSVINPGGAWLQRILHFRCLIETKNLRLSKRSRVSAFLIWKRKPVSMCPKDLQDVVNLRLQEIPFFNQPNGVNSAPPKFRRNLDTKTESQFDLPFGGKNNEQQNHRYQVKLAVIVAWKLENIQLGTRSEVKIIEFVTISSDFRESKLVCLLSLYISDRFFSFLWSLKLPFKSCWATLT